MDASARARESASNIAANTGNRTFTLRNPGSTALPDIDIRNRITSQHLPIGMRMNGVSSRLRPCKSHNVISHLNAFCFMPVVNGSEINSICDGFAMPVTLNDPDSRPTLSMKIFVITSDQIEGVC